MPKLHTVYVCQKCEYQSPKWIGKCPQCESWNSFIEDVVADAQKSGSAMRSGIAGRPRTPQEYNAVISALGKTTERTPTGINELDRVLGAGIVHGSVILLSGEPGIGKSTLTLQLCEALSNQNQQVLYISGEESETQISMRGKRLGLNLKNLALLTETNLETIVATIEKEKPQFVVIDSIQVTYSEQLPGGAGTVTQVRLCTEALMHIAKSQKIPMLIIGHVTKEGNLAGPRVLEHLVDVVLFLEGDRNHEFRLLRGIKNRFGAVSEIGVFEMVEKGLAEIKNPSSRFLEERNAKIPGTAVVCTIEGTRPFLVEVQALTAVTRFGYPKRTASGFDINRLQLLLAVIEQKLGVNLGNQDVYINVVGGMTLSEPACDLGVCLAVLSSLKKKSLPHDFAAIGEVGLSGEIRKVPQLEKRLKEAKRLGFTSLQKKSLKEYYELLE